MEDLLVGLWLRIELITDFGSRSTPSCLLPTLRCYKGENYVGCNVPDVRMREGHPWLALKSLFGK